MRIYPLSNPFLALRSFSRQDAARFYGRDADLVLIQSRLYSSRTTLLFASSGVGKTSLIDARLTPMLESHMCVVTHRSWAARPPLDELCSAIAATAPTLGIDSLAPVVQLERLAEEAGARQQVLLILDQFEEVFQHWRDTKALDLFAQEVARVVHATTIDARVFFSMREEFLGELSLFDNLIPDLFNNCYRLKNPTRAEAEEIIEKTAYSEQKVECGPGLEPLLDDLLAAPRATSASATDAAPSSRSRVPMPFLQIVCHRLWERQMGRMHGIGRAFPQRFLESHAIGQAPLQLDGYCREKLEGLTDGERDVAAAAFGFLMTPAGAKMAYPIDVLALQARVPEDQLWNVLQKLCAPDVRILRQIPGGRGSRPWVELYHDLYARFLSDWKRTHEQARHEEAERRLKEDNDRRVEEYVQQAVAKNARRLQLYKRLAGVAPLAMLALVLLFNSYTAYVNHYWPLKQFALAASTTPDADAYLSARNSVNELKNTAFSRWAQSWWARYWNQRAQREMLAGQTEQALLSQIRSLQEVDDDKVRRQLTAWLSFGETLRTFRAPEEILSFGFLRAPNQVYATLNGCRIIFWDRATGRLLQTWSPSREMLRCESVSAISPNARYAVVVGSVLDQGLRVPSASVVDLESNKISWNRRGEITTVNASFSPDSRHVVMVLDTTAGRTAIVISASDGSAKQLAIPSATAQENRFAEYRYSPFTGRLVGNSSRHIVVLSPDGSGPGRELSVAETWASASGLNVHHLIPLPDDRFAATFIDRMIVPGTAGSTSLPFAPKLWANDYSVAPDGKSLFFPQPDGGICQVSIDRPSCELLVLPTGNSYRFFTATSAETALLTNPKSQTITEMRLGRISAAKPLNVDAAWDSVRMSPDGRWLVAFVGRGCFLIDLDGQVQKRQIASPCDSALSFSPSGARLLETGVGGWPQTLVDPQTLGRVALERPNEFVDWASRDYLAFGTSAEGVSLLSMRSNAVDPADLAAATRFLPDLDVDRTKCPSTQGSVVVSPDGRFGVVREAEGLALFQKASGKWATRIPIHNSKRACVAAFSPDSSQLLGTPNGTIVSVWKTSDGTGVRSLTDQFQPIQAVRFGATKQSVVAVVKQNESLDLMLWDVSGPELPLWRVPVRGEILVLPQTASSIGAVATARAVAWLKTENPDATDIAVQPLPFTAILHHAAIAITANDSIRVLRRASDDRWHLSSFKADLSDVQAFALPESKSWPILLKEWSERLDLRLDEATGRYQPVSTVEPPPAVAPASVRQP